MENKRINKLMMPFTRKALSLLSAVTIMTTSIGCSDKDKNKDNNSDISSITNSSSSMEEISSELDVIESVDSNSSITSEINTNNTSKESQTSTKPSSSSTTSNTQSSNKPQNNNQNSSINNSSNTSTNSSQTPSTEQQMPTSLTADNINDVAVFREFSKEIALNTRGNFGGIWNYTYNGENYQILGAPEDEFNYILAGLNIDYISNETLSTIFESKSLDDLKRYNSIISLLIAALDNANKQNNWDNLIIDKSILSYMKQIESAYLDYKNNVDKDKLRNLLDGQMNCSNAIVRRYFSCACSKLLRTDDYDNYKYNSLSTDLHFETKDEIEQFSIDLYDKIKSRTKVLN